MSTTEAPYAAALEARAAKHLTRHMQAVERPDPRWITVDGADYINFSSNDTLALSFHPTLQQRSAEWAQQYGSGSGASRLVTGNLHLFEQIETKIAQLKQKEAALIFASGFQANSSILSALLDKDILGKTPLVFTDRLIHASLHHGLAAAGVRQIRFRHNDTNHLETLLNKHKESQQPKFIITESVFSMDGDVADLQALAQLAKTHKAMLIIDEAHATGVLGKNGAGLTSGLDDIDLSIGTFSKALGGFGAYVACSQILRDFLINHCNGLIYSTALPPSVLGAMDAALDALPLLEEARYRALYLAKLFRKESQELGFETGSSTTHIVPIIAGTAETALTWQAKMKEANLWVQAIRPPTVPKETARLRFSFNAAHQEGDVRRALDVLKEVF